MNIFEMQLLVEGTMRDHKALQNLCEWKKLRQSCRTTVLCCVCLQAKLTFKN